VFEKILEKDEQSVINVEILNLLNGLLLIQVGKEKLVELSMTEIKAEK